MQNWRDLEKIDEVGIEENKEYSPLGDSRETEFYASFSQTQDDALIKEYKTLIQQNKEKIIEYEDIVLRKLGVEIYEGQLFYLYCEKGVYIGFVFRYNNSNRYFYQVKPIKLSILLTIFDLNKINIKKNIIEEQGRLLSKEAERELRSEKFCYNRDIKYNQAFLDKVKKKFDDMVVESKVIVKKTSCINAKLIIENDKEDYKICYSYIAPFEDKIIRTKYYNVRKLINDDKKGFLNFFLEDEFRKMEAYSTQVEANRYEKEEIEKMFNEIFYSLTNQLGSNIMMPVKKIDGTYTYNFKYTNFLENKDTLETHYYPIKDLLHINEIEAKFDNIFYQQINEKGYFKRKPIENEDGTYTYSISYCNVLRNGNPFETTEYPIETLIKAFKDDKLDELIIKEKGKVIELRNQ